MANFAGHSLIGRAVMSATASRCVGRTVISTDSQEFAEEAVRYGAESPFLRPASLANDTATSFQVAQHCLEMLHEQEGYQSDWLVLLQPTSPLRTSDDIDRAFDLAYAKECQAVVSVCEPSQHPLLAKGVDGTGYLTPLYSATAARRQDLPRALLPNGAIYWVRVEALLKERTFYPERTLPYVMPPERSVDIDNEIDLAWARFLYGA